MRSILSYGEALLIWGAFFGTTVYGHVALKVAAGASNRYEYRKALSVLGNVWGWTAILAWTFSALLWVLILTRHTVVSANAISALRYVLISLAALTVLHEPLQCQSAFGMLLVAIGILLIAK